MNRNTVHAALIGSVGALSLWQPSHAQQAASATPGVLEEVVVIARRRSENLQEVPIAVTAYSGAALQERGIKSPADLQFYVPSLTVTGQQRDLANVTIRGQGGFAPGGTASVVTYVNEVPLPFVPPGLYGGASLYYDLDTLQVLKGPQGTLFGRNTTGGALLVQSRRPADELEGHVELGLGNYKERSGELVLNVPLVPEKASLRLAGIREVRDGFTRMLPSASQPNGLDLDNRDHWAGRVSARIKPAENLTNDVIFDYFAARTHGTGYVLAAVNPASFVPLLFPAINQFFAQQQALGIRAVVPYDNTPFLKAHRYGVTDLLEWQIDESFTFRNVFAFRHEGDQSNRDNDATSLLIFEQGNHFGPLVQRQFSEEPQFHAKLFDGRVTGVIGGFYLKSPAEPFSTEDRVTFGRPIVFNQRTHEQTRALYAQGTYDLSEIASGLRFTGGFRYSWDKRFLQTRQLTAGACNSPGSDALCTLTGDGKFHAPTWTVGLDYQLTPQALAYLTSRRGYRSGGFNPSAILPEHKDFFPEYVTDVEAGLKADWIVAGMAARTNLAAYYQKYTDVQLNHTVLELGAVASVTENIAEASIYGLEFEGQLVPFKGLQLNLTYSWGYPNFDRYAAGTDAASIANYNWANFPRHKVNVGFRYQLPLDANVGTVKVGADLSWQSRYFVSTARDPLDRQDAFGLLNISANWDGIAGYPLDLSVFGTNMTNRIYKSGSFTLYLPLGITTVPYGEPRMYGARLRYRFGAEK